MIKKIASGLIVAAAISIPLAPIASAQEEEEPPPPLSAEGLCHCDLPTLSAEGLFGIPSDPPPLSAEGLFGIPSDPPPLSAEGILSRIFVIFGNGR